MRYTHGFKLIRERHHALRLSVLITVLSLGLIFALGFKTLDLERFSIGFLESLGRVLIAYVLSLGFALALALIVSASQKLEDTFLPILDALQSFPSFALYPLLLIWFGKSSLVTILILLVEMIWPILFTVLSGRKQLRGDILEAANVFGASGFRFYRFVLTPLLLPSIVTGSIIAWGEAWETIIAAEIIVNINGIGTYLASLGENSDFKLLMVGIVLLLAVLFLINKYVWVPLLVHSSKYQQES